MHFISSAYEWGRAPWKSYALPTYVIISINNKCVVLECSPFLSIMWHLHNYENISLTTNTYLDKELIGKNIMGMNTKKPNGIRRTAVVLLKSSEGHPKTGRHLRIRWNSVRWFLVNYRNGNLQNKSRKPLFRLTMVKLVKFKNEA